MHYEGNSEKRDSIGITMSAYDVYPNRGKSTAN